jgi:hypothetical protein
MRRVLALLAAVSVALFAVAAAGAKTINDPNDTSGQIDIKKATFSKTKSGKYKIVVVFFEDVPAKGEQGNEVINIWKKKPHTLQNCGGCFKEAFYQMQGPQTGKQAVRYNCGAEDSPCKKTGTGKIKRDGNKLTFTFPPKAVGSPKDKLFWRVQSFYYGNSDECPSFDDCVDKAPNGTKLVKETL